MVTTSDRTVRSWRRGVLVVVTMMAALAIGCVEDNERSFVDDGDEPDVVAVAREAQNSLGENSLGFYAAQFNRMVREPFTQTATTARLAAEGKGDALLDYAARCTFLPGLTVRIKDVRGAWHTYPKPLPPPYRSLGLAPKWPSRALDSTEERWLMSCLLAHVNAVPVAVGISVRGAHPALATTPAEKARFKFVEGAFYGRFGDAGDPDEAGITYQYACYSHELLAGCGNDVLATEEALKNRMCTVPAACAHFRVVGPCPDALGNGHHACGSNPDGTFAPCYDTLSQAPSSWPVGEKYPEAITVMLEVPPTCADYGVF